MSRKCRDLANGAILPETIPSLVSSLPQDLPDIFGMLRRLQTSHFLTLESKKPVALTYDLESLDYLKGKLRTILEFYNLQLDNIDGLTKDALINSSVDLGLSLADVGRRLFCLSDIVDVLSKAGNLIRAFSIAKHIPIVSDQGTCLRSLVQVALKIHDVDIATQIAHQIPDNVQKYNSLIEIVESVLKLRNFKTALDICDQAIIVVNLIPFDFFKSNMLKNIVHYLVQSRDLEKAFVTAKSIPDEDIKLLCLEKISKLPIVSKACRRSR